MVINKGLPFNIKSTPQITENGLTEEQETEILEVSKKAKQGIDVNTFASADEFLDSLKKEADT